MNELELLAREAAGRYGLDPRLICALCEVESAWKPWAVRHEAGYEYLYGYHHVFEDSELAASSTRKLIKDAARNWFIRAKIVTNYDLNDYAAWQTELLFQQTSWGLMQIMGAVARERGFRGWLTELCDPQVNLEWDCRHLRWMLDHPLDYGLSIAQGPAVLKGTLADLAAAWNGGARVVMDGKYKNQPYVDRVVKAMEGYQ